GHRNDGGSALGDGGGEPGRPTSFRRSGDDETGGAGSLNLCQVFADCVHRPGGTFYHRKEQRPVALAGFETLGKGISDEVVFVESAEKWLVRHLFDDGDRDADRLRYLYAEL